MTVDVGPAPGRTRPAPRGPGGRRALVGRPVFASAALRRVVYAVVFEALAVLFTTGILAALGNAGGPSLVVAVVSSTVALLWNVLFNTLFERFERRVGVTHRPWWMRVAHAVGFEGGLLVFLVPAVADDARRALFRYTRARRGGASNACPRWHRFPRRCDPIPRLAGAQG